MEAILKKANFVLKNYIEISKPRSVLLLYFTGLTAIIIASSIYGFNLAKIMLASIAIIFGTMGSNSITNYIDREMDAVMERTNRRAIPEERIKPARTALIYGGFLVIAGIIIASLINYWSGFFLFLGFFDSAIIYNLITKKKTPFSVVLGSPAGGLPVIVGWIAVAGKLDLIAVFLFLFIFVWTLGHIWSLGYFYKEDYRKANIPILTAIIGDKKIFSLLLALNLLMFSLSIAFGIIYSLSIIYFLVNIILGLALITINILLMVKRNKNYAWLLFKASSPYLAVVFLTIFLDIMVY